MADLAERMSKTVKGQLTWADLDRKEKCLSCKHIGRHPKPKLNADYVCTLVKVHTGRVGEPFNAARAIACSKFEAL